MKDEKRQPRSYKAKDTPYFKAQKTAANRKTTLCEVLEKFIADYGANKNPFVFHKHAFAISIDDPNGSGAIPSDLLFQGELENVASALVQQMEKHPELSNIIEGETLE